MSTYQKRDIVDTRNVIAKIISKMDEQLKAENTDWQQIRRQLQRIEDRCSETRQMITALHSQ